MSSDAFSPRHRASPLGRRRRDPAASTQSCLEVQWRFLQHSNPKPPQLQSPTGRQQPLGLHPNDSTIHAPNRSASGYRHYPVTSDSPSKLFHLFETQEVDAELANPPISTQVAVQPSAPPSKSRVLNDLMGETQRQAMLDRILGEMEDLAVEPIYLRLGQPGTSSPTNAKSPHPRRRASVLQSVLQSDCSAPSSPSSPKGVSLLPQRKFSSLGAISGRECYSDDEDDDDSQEGEEEDVLGGSEGRDRDVSGTGKAGKRYHRHKLQQRNEDDQASRVFWQKSTGVKFATDVPLSLLTLSPSPPRRLHKASTIVMGRRTHSPLPSSSNAGRRRTKHIPKRIPSALPEPLDPGATPSYVEVQPQLQAASNGSPMTSRRRSPRRPPASTAASGPVSPPKGQYGAWYVPPEEWSTLHQLEQQALMDKFPAVAVASSPCCEPHCHHTGASSPLQRQHKPSLPAAALSPRSNSPSAAAIPGFQTPRGPSNAANSGRRASLICRGVTTTPSAGASSGGTSLSPLELQAAAIPQSYIGREYRAYILNTGASLPPYLQ
ncbi:hypothetical protein BBJ28_00002994 [Nothophytophthora sp. Chile5]|nr:hypothetical protein BBJ28_00002994 [Nothophytophthora sp. Chile5]